MTRARSRRLVADFDSASAMVRALARFHEGRDASMLARYPLPARGALRVLGPAVNRLPVPLRDEVYRLASGSEAAPREAIARLDGEALSRWVVDQYPAREYPAVFLGSSNGALAHLAAAMGAAFLPQTLLVPVLRPFADPDDPMEDLARTRETAARMLDRNPDLALHQMHDANQDRLTIRHLSYFRVKRLRLGSTYERFLRERLAPGGVLVLSECALAWPGTLVRERHVFQHGAPGGATPEEYEHGSPRVAAYLAREGVARRAWTYPPTEGDFPEAEWGFAPPLREDALRFARERGHPVRRVLHDHPERASPPVADLHRWWYARRRIPPRRLLVESFLLLDPHWALRTGSVPFWTMFGVEDSRAALERYLDAGGGFDEIYAVLFSHGVASVGAEPIEGWRRALGRARARSAFVGVDEEAYPRDFAVFTRFPRDLARKVPARHPLPPPLRLDEVDAFLRRAPGWPGFAWTAAGGEPPTFSPAPARALDEEPAWRRSTPAS